MKRRFGENYRTRRIALLAVLTAMSLIVFVVESFFPPIFLPGAKLGLANIFSLLALVLWSPAEAVLTVLARTLLGGFIVGNLTSLIYSCAAGLASILCASLLTRMIGRISLISVSVAAAVVHNIVQNLVFCALSQTPQMIAYLPYLAILGVFSGAVVGIAAYLILAYVPQTVYGKSLRPDNAADAETRAERTASHSKNTAPEGALYYEEENNR